MKCRFLSFIGIISLVIIHVDESAACEGHKFKLHYLRNCGDLAKNVVKVQENSTLTVTDDCVIIPNACAETTGFQTAQAKISVWKNNLPILKQDVDVCEAMGKMSPDVKAILKVFGLPTKCPFEKMKKCEDGSKKTEILNKFRKFVYLGRGGPIKIQLKLDHDSGHSCIESEFEIIKK